MQRRALSPLPSSPGLLSCCAATSTSHGQVLSQTTSSELQHCGRDGHGDKAVWGHGVDGWVTASSSQDAGSIISAAGASD